MRRWILINSKTREITEYQAIGVNDLEKKLGKDYVIGRKYAGAICYISKPRKDEKYFFAIGNDNFGGNGVITGWPSANGLTDCPISIETLKKDVHFFKMFRHRKND